MQDEELLPCPFCAGEAHSQFIDNKSSLGVGMVECGGCGATMQGIDEADAIAKWNLRAITDTLVEIERLCGEARGWRLLRIQTIARNARALTKATDTESDR